MKHYTVEAQTTDKSVNIAESKEKVERAFSSIGRLCRVVHIAVDQDIMVMKMQSELSRDAVAKILAGLESRTGLKLKNVGWGWPSERLLDDPYHNTEPQAEEERTYSGGRGHKFDFWFAFVVFLGSLILIVTPLALVGIAWCFIVGYGVIIRGLPYAYGLVHRVASVTCGKDGLVIKFWVRPSIRVTWAEICGVSIRFNRVLWCHIQTCWKSPFFPIVFPVGQGLALKESNTLVRTIIDRASLLFVEGYGSECGLYKRFEAQ